jgi:hypothetical protein
LILIQLFQGGCADHATVSDNTEIADAKAAAKSFDLRYQSSHIGRVPRPHFTTDRPTVVVENGTNHHLVQIWPVVFTKAPFTKVTTALTLEVDRGRIEKDQVQLTKNP